MTSIFNVKELVMIFKDKLTVIFEKSLKITIG